MIIRGRVKGRSLTTYSNKLRKLKSRYVKTFYNSKKSKEKNEIAGYNKSSYFYLSYPTEQSFLEKNEIKESNKNKGV